MGVVGQLYRAHAKAQKHSRLDRVNQNRMREFAITASGAALPQADDDYEMMELAEDIDL